MALADPITGAVDGRSFRAGSGGIDPSVSPARERSSIRMARAGISHISLEIKTSQKK